MATAVATLQSLPILQSPSQPRILLVGCPNVGKTSLFNALALARAKTANYPGVTVDVREAAITLRDPELSDCGATPVRLIDLPGLYSLEAISPEEQLTAKQLQNCSGSDLIVVVVDATNLSRTLVLASEVLELNHPTLVVVNQIDIAIAEGAEIDLAALQERLECPVVAVSARTGRGLDELRRTLREMTAQRRQEIAPQRLSCAAGCTGCPFTARFDWAEGISSAVVRGDIRSSPTLERLDRWLTSPVIGLFALAAIMLTVFIMIFSLADVPMGMIEGLFASLAEWVDAYLPTWLPRWQWSGVAFGVAAALLAGGYAAMGVQFRVRNLSIAAVLAAIAAALPPGEFQSLVVDGVIGGIGGVVVFLPQICILFLFISLLEDSGYMARGAFVMERVMQRVGLPGKAFVPMLSAHACAIPAIMASRTIENWRDRLSTIFVLPILTCSARLPVYAMIAALLFGDSPVRAGMMFAAAYSLGVIAALGSAWLLKGTLLKGRAAPLVIELPQYRWPSLRNAALTVLDRAVVFLRQAGGAILMISIALWAAATYPRLPDNRQFDDAAAEAQAALEYSLAGRVGQAIEPVFAPLGFDWKIDIGVMTSFAAREVLVSTLSIVYGLGEDSEDTAGLVERLRRQEHPDGSPVFTTATSLSLLVFFVLAMQCLPTLAVTRRETGTWKWAIGQFVYMSVLAYVAALLTYQIASRVL